ncbi:MAG: mechanosensitive ion channel family protein [Sporolactobacillus sp.]
MERLIEKLNWMTQISWSDGLIALAILLAFYLAALLFSRYLPRILAKLSKLSKNQIDDALIISFRKPIALILMVTGVYLALSYLPIPRSSVKIIRLFYSSFATLSIGWGFYLFSNAIGAFFGRMGDRFDLQFNNIIIPFLSKIAKFLVVVFTLVGILDQWNYHVTGLITGLGIGGLAIAMAAKDTLSNFFGGIVIITDAPFTIGESIQSGTIEGVVEDINFRSTRIRTADQALVTVPNSTLANQPITNMSRIGKRRVAFSAPLDIGTTSQQLQSCLKQIRQLLSDNDALYEDGQMVYLDKISPTSIDLTVQFYTKTIDFNEWTKIKETFNMSLIDILAKEGVELASSKLPLDFQSKEPIKEKIELAAKKEQPANDELEKQIHSRSRDN